MYPTRILRVPPPKPSITGFDVKEYSRAATQPRYDPWERAETWRYTGTFSRWNRFKGAFPGLGIATVAFVAYLGYEQLFLKEDHHGDAHGEGHH
ncbi:NADH-ubiquinone oxidoreductase B12 subunit family-domain-containing protein [Nemania serpens]|nr:NADH-ubiquinone oxidoreductase B12 subunit family-domain-containing protein [Nemania serpens]